MNRSSIAGYGLRTQGNFVNFGSSGHPILIRKEAVRWQIMRTVWPLRGKSFSDAECVRHDKPLRDCDTCGSAWLGFLKDEGVLRDDGKNRHKRAGRQSRKDST